MATGSSVGLNLSPLFSSSLVSDVIYYGITISDLTTQAETGLRSVITNESCHMACDMARETIIYDDDIFLRVF